MPGIQLVQVNLAQSAGQPALTPDAGASQLAGHCIGPALPSSSPPNSSATCPHVAGDHPSSRTLMDHGFQKRALEDPKAVPAAKRPTLAGPFNLESLVANGFAPFGLRAAVTAQINKRNQEAPAGQARVTQQQLAQHCRLTQAQLAHLLGGKIRLPEAAVEPLKGFLMGEPLNLDEVASGPFNLESLVANELAPFGLRAAVTAQVDRRNQEAPAGQARATQQQLAQHCRLIPTKLNNLLRCKIKLPEAAVEPLKGFLMGEPLNLDDTAAGPFNLESLVANGLAPLGLRAEVIAQVDRRNQEAPAGQARVTRQQLAQHCRLTSRQQLNSLLDRKFKLPASAVEPLKGFLMGEPLNLDDTAAGPFDQTSQLPISEASPGRESMSTTGSDREPMEVDLPGVRIKEEPVDTWQWPTKNTIDNSRPFYQLPASVEAKSSPDNGSGEPSLGFLGSLRGMGLKDDDKARVLKEVREWLALDRSSRAEAFDNLLESYTIADNDPRVGLRGQQGVRAKRDIASKEVIGAYAGLYLSGDEAFFQERHIQGGLNVERYNFGFHKSNASISGFGHGNILSQINASTTYAPGEEADRSKGNVGIFEIDVGTNKYLFFFALRAIAKDDELLFDYGHQYWKSMMRPINVDTGRSPLLFGYLNQDGQLVRDR
ncbi:MAG: SET domain-containing protein-lysine N-methyltransferase [Geminicoccaceae bacterium]